MYLLETTGKKMDHQEEEYRAGGERHEKQDDEVRL